MDVQQFKPEEINVKVVDNYLVVDAKHEEREDSHGYISRHFTRRYKIPSDVDIDAIKSKLSSDGILTLEAPKKVSSLVCTTGFYCILLYEKGYSSLLIYSCFYTINILSRSFSYCFV